MLSSPSGAIVYGAALRAQRNDWEKRIEDDVVAALERRGIPARRQVVTTCGRADVVTDDTVYEIKTGLSLDVLFRAVGQVTLYAASLGKKRRVIVGHEVVGLESTYDLVRSLDIGVVALPHAGVARHRCNRCTKRLNEL